MRATCRYLARWRRTCRVLGNDSAKGRISAVHHANQATSSYRTGQSVLPASNCSFITTKASSAQLTKFHRRFQSLSAWALNGAYTALDRGAPRNGRQAQKNRGPISHYTIAPQLDLLWKILTLNCYDSLLCFECVRRTTSTLDSSNTQWPPGSPVTERPHYSVVFPSKCSAEAFASALVTRMMPSR